MTIYSNPIIQALLRWSYLILNYQTTLTGRFDAWTIFFLHHTPVYSSIIRIPNKWYCPGFWGKLYDLMCQNSYQYDWHIIELGGWRLLLSQLLLILSTSRGWYYSKFKMWMLIIIIVSMELIYFLNSGTLINKIYPIHIG